MKPAALPSKRSAETFGDRAVQSWNRFWFTPADPTVLGLIRICCGLITLYTVMAYSLNLDEFFGEHAWLNLEAALRDLNHRPWYVSPLRGEELPPEPANQFQDTYMKRFKPPLGYAPWPYPSTDEQLRFAIDFQKQYGFDFRLYHMPFPETQEQEDYLEKFAKRWGEPPAPPYPVDQQEAHDINEYIKHYEVNPRRLYEMGLPSWSIWFHVTDPAWMRLVHTAIVMITFLFTIGFCTRLTSALTWFGQLCYIHRAEMVLFGVDTMMAILLLYLMIGPSGAALSVDRRLARRWREVRPRVIARWRAWWRRPVGEVAFEPEATRPNVTTHHSPLTTHQVQPEPLVSANFAVRLLQIHVCFIYLAAGLSKLLGQAWWNGSAPWAIFANFEFAPMHFEIYNTLLRLLGENQLVFTLVMTGVSYFTLFFEIGYAFLIWRPATRWLMLSMAIALHASIAVFMGLKTFSLMMLVMNMAFVKPEEAKWFLEKSRAFLARYTSWLNSATGKPEWTAKSS